MSKITVTGQLTLTGGQLTAKETPAAAPSAGKELWAWGLSAPLGYVGDNTIINRSSPVQIGALTDWGANTNADSGFNLTIKTDGTLWAFGRGNGGRIPDELNINKSSPVQVGALTDWAVANAGTYHANAIKTDGTLWAWGQQGGRGQLGDGTVIDRSSPVQIGSLTDWATVNCGQKHTLAIKTDGTLWAWGYNYQGQLGNGLTNPPGNQGTSSPIQIGNLTNWLKLGNGAFHSLAVKTDGTMWSWGQNISGRLGLGDTVSRSSPVQIGSLTDWAFPGAGDIRSHAIKTDGTLWAMGIQGDALGTSGVSPDSSVIQVGALSDWATVDSGGNDRAVALKTDGTIWTWGRADGGQGGHGNTTNYNSPVQVGSLTDWSSIETSSNTTFATKNAP